MNKEKIAEELNAWTASEAGSGFETDIYNDDLTLFYDDECIAWFTNFEADKFGFVSPSDHQVSIELTQKDVIKKFYEKGVELLTKSESKYTVQVLPSEYGFLYKLKNDLSYLTTSDVGNDCTFNLQWGYFTQSEIDELKQRDDLAINWDKAIIKEVE